jgi:hypothetical protein
VGRVFRGRKPFEGHAALANGYAGRVFLGKFTNMNGKDQSTIAEQKKAPSLTQTASRGAFWSLAGNITVSAISFVGTAVLARMLDPKDFGLDLGYTKEL